MTLFEIEQLVYCSYKNYENNHCEARQNLTQNLPIAIHTDDSKTLDFYQESNTSHHEQCCAAQYTNEMITRMKTWIIKTYWTFLHNSSKTGRVPVNIGNKKQWVLYGKFTERLRADLHEQQKSWRTSFSNDHRTLLYILLQ